MGVKMSLTIKSDSSLKNLEHLASLAMKMQKNPSQVGSGNN